MAKVTLAGAGLRIGDLVTYSSDDDSTGGIIFRIEENCDAVKPSGGSVHNPLDETGKKMPAMKVAGYLRLKPLFSFFPTNLGLNPRGKGGTVLLHHSALYRVVKVDLVTLGTKYVELGNLIRYLATKDVEEAP